MDAEQKLILERTVDRYGLAAVLSELGAISGKKSEHIATNWQDAGLAKQWDRAARRIRDCANAVRHWGLT